MLRKSVDALKVFNNAISTSRVYPPGSPQISNAIEVAYKGIRLFLQNYGLLRFSFDGESLLLCGQPLTEEILVAFPNLIVYRQLRLLELSQLVITPEMDRFAFGQILSVFNAPAKKIQIEGGGLEFITGLGLASYFVEKEAEEVKKVVEQESKSSAPKKMEKVQMELLASLYGKDKRAEAQLELKKHMADSSSAIEIFAAGIGHILSNIQAKKGLAAHQSFSMLFENGEGLIGEGNRAQVAQGLGRRLIESLKTPALCVFLSQEYSHGLGRTVFDSTTSLLNKESFSKIIVILKEQRAKAKLIGGENSSAEQFLDQSLLRLLNTEKGKQFIGVEKARSLLKKGELDRKKSRFQVGVRGVLQGNLEHLQSDEFVALLPGAVLQMAKNNDVVNVKALLAKVIEQFESTNTSEHGPLQKCLVVIGEKLVANNKWESFDILLDPFMNFLRKVTAEDVFLERIVNLLHLAMQNSWQSGENYRGDTILTLFYQIRTGHISKTASIRSIVGRIQDTGLKRARLPKLLDKCFAAPQNEVLGYRLIYQGPIAIRFLVESLITIDNYDHRIKIIDLLTDSEEFLTPIIHERLQEHMPWYGKRNLLKLLGETGNEGDAEAALPYFKHDDFRVQREAFLCIYRIGGKSRKQLFMTSFDDSSELIKIQIISAFVAFCDQEVAGFLSGLLVGYKDFSEKNRDTLLSKILETLGRCTCPEALKGVKAFLQTKGQRSKKDIDSQVWDVAEKSLSYLEDDLQEVKKKRQLRKKALQQLAQMGKSLDKRGIITGLPQEQAIRGLISREDMAGVKEQLIQLIEKISRLRNFIQAGQLREWLIQIDPTDLGSIMQAGEIIDQEKVAAIDETHLEIWNRLYEALTTEEFSAVYHSLSHNRYSGDEIIVNQGAMQTSLFFINSGQVKLYFGDQGNEVLVRSMGSGDIFGAGAFFEASVWTISAASLGKTDISVLKLDKLDHWKDAFPALESKLRDFCANFESVENFIKRSSNDRRHYERHKVSGSISIELLDGKGQNVGVNSTVELIEISESGLSYVARIPQKETARLFLGRKVELQLPTGKQPAEHIKNIADILAVKSMSQEENNYSVHVCFEKPIGKHLLQKILMALPRES